MKKARRSRRQFSRIVVASVALAACTADSTPPVAPVTSIATAAAARKDQPGRSCAAKFYVSGKAAKKGNGGEAQPFTDLASAIAAAGKSKCDVDIVLGRGSYDLGDTPVTLTRQISIVGKGRPTILGRFVIQTSERISLSHLALQAPNKKEGVLILADGKGGQGGFLPDLSLDHLRFLESLGFGLYVVGGTVSVWDTEFNDIGAAFNPGSGTGLFAGGGARVTLRNVRMRRNAHGLLASGMGTAVLAEGLVVEHSGGIPPSLIATIDHECRGLASLHLGAVEFTDHAVGRGSHWTIFDSGLIGLYSHHGADVDVSNVEVDQTYQVGPSESAQCGGFGMGSFYGGAMTVRGFTVANSAVCGVTVASNTTVDPALTAATALDLHDGVVKVAPVGACVMLEGYDTNRLHDHVLFVDVGVPLQALSYSLPDVF